MKGARGLLSLLVFGLFSCAPVKDLEVKGVKSFSIKELDAKGLESELQLTIHNPNKFGFKILPSEFDIRYSGMYLGKAKLTKRVRIHGNEDKAYTFQLKNDFKTVNFLEILTLLRPGAFRDEMEIKGELKAGKLFMRKRFPVQYKDKIGLN